MSVTPGPWAIPSASIANGRSAAVPGSNTVSMWPMRSSRGAPGVPRSPSQVPMTVPPNRPDGSGRRSTRAPLSARNPATNEPTSSTPGGRVRAAIDVDEALEVGEVGGLGGADGGLDARRARRPRRRRPARSGCPCPKSRCAPAVPARRPRLCCRDRARDRDPTARGPERLPARAGGEDRGRARPAADVVRPAKPGPPRARPPRRRRARRGSGRSRSTRSSAGSAACGSTTARARAACRPSLVGPGPLDRHVPVDRRGAGPHDRRGGARPRRAGRLARAPGPARPAPRSGCSPAGRRRSPRPGPRRRRGSGTPTAGCRSSRSPARTARAR